MAKKTYFIKTVPGTVPVKLEIILSKPNYSKPVLFIAKDSNGKPSTAPGKHWYVSFYYRNPETELMQKFMYKDDINRLKTVKERKEFGKQLAESYHELLKMGFNPFDANGIPTQEFEEITNYTITEAIKYVLDYKTNLLKQSTIDDYKLRLNHFKEWCTEVRIDNLNISEYNKRHVIAFLKTKSHLSATSINNYRRAISAVFGVLSGEGIINTNIASDIPTIKSSPQKNIPFTKKEIENIKKWCLKHDPYLLQVVQFIFYGFIRPVEAVRLRVENFDFTNHIYRIETKSDVFKTKVLLPKLETITLKNIKKSKKNTGYLFTNLNSVGEWDLKEKQRYSHFNRRFVKCKNALGFGKLHGMHSLRHSGALDQYNFFKKQGMYEHEIIQKMLPITGHKSEQSLRAYLRDIDSNLPVGYEANFSIDL